MATSVQQNLVQKNQEYASNFKEGDLALPPAKKYAVGQSSSYRPYTREAECCDVDVANLDSDVHGRSHRPGCSLRNLIG